MVVLPFSWWDLMQTIRTGEVVTDLSKPCDFYWYWFSREIGRDAYYLLFRAIPTYAIGAGGRDAGGDNRTLLHRLLHSASVFSGVAARDRRVAAL